MVFATVRMEVLHKGLKGITRESVHQQLHVINVVSKSMSSESIPLCSLHDCSQKPHRHYYDVEPLVFELIFSM